MDRRALIDAVRTRPPLWDHTNKNYHNRDAIHKLWTEVASQVQSTKEEVQKKWKCLRDVFRRELRKMPNFNAGSDPNATSTWLYFNDLLFLKDVMIMRGISGKNEALSPEAEDTIEHHQMYLSPSTVLQDEEEDDYDEEEAEEERRRLVKRKRLEPPYYGGGLHVEDDDYHFLLSLLPYLKKMPDKTKLYFRLKSQELLFDTLCRLEKEESQPPPPPPPPPNSNRENPLPPSSSSSSPSSSS